MMSDGGKGDSPRPFSVSQETFGNNYDAIFRKKETTPRVQEDKKEFGSCDGSHSQPCNCRKCLQARGEMLSYSVGTTLLNMPGPNKGFYGMVVCPKCGNKRCPHATDHNNACTNSNEPGQEGSIY